MVVQLRCCPKCVGDVFLERGLDGEEWVCIQCGYRYEILVISSTHVLGSGRRVGIVQVSEAFDVRFDRAADSDLSRTQWAPANLLKRTRPRPSLSGPGEQYQKAAEVPYADGHKNHITTLRGAA